MLIMLPISVTFHPYEYCTTHMHDWSELHLAPEEAKASKLDA